ncbi:MAG: pyridoxal phosphate-dependent aminotransferase [Phycisphaerales bacterium]|nr:pyridoxal phosphate-dependent aminotransferase [Phycisphaerales bacterium]
MTATAMKGPGVILAGVQIASRIESMKESATLAVSAKAAALKAKGVDVISFGVGEPDFDTPQNIKRVAIEALLAGKTKYPPTAGDKPAREAVAHKLRLENGIACRAEDVTITVGAKHAIYLALQTMIDPGRGQEVLLPTPAWVSYKPLIELAGATCVEVPGSIDNQFHITPDQLARAITPRTVAIILNSPSNPCGTVYTAAALRELADVLSRNSRVTIISDEIYEKLIYPEIEPGLTHWSPGSDPRLAERTITINGMSKAYAMTGWRLGYLAAPGQSGAFAREVIKLQGQMTNSVTSFCLPAIVEALTNGAAEVESMRNVFMTRARLVFQHLAAIPRLRTVAPTGAFYAFPDVSACLGCTTPAGRRIGSAQDFAEAILDEEAVALVPGEDFGECARTHVRISFACSEKQITDGVARLSRFCAALR